VSTPMRTFEVERAQVSGKPVLRLRGRLTLGEGSRVLRRAVEGVAGEGHKRLMLDLAAVSYVDSSGLGAMVAAYNSLKNAGGAVGLSHVPVRVRELLEMSGLDAVFRICGNDQEAAEFFSDS
jgi:anti-anti-sigma factor